MLAVYLDTQDYIKLNSGGGRFEALRQQLSHYATQGLASFGISFPAFFEFVQPDLSPGRIFTADRLSRTAFIACFCDGWSYPHISDLIDRSRPAKNGVWVPQRYLEGISMQEFAKGLRSEAARSLAKLKHPGFNREYRRRLARSPDEFKALVRRHPEMLVGKPLDPWHLEQANLPADLRILTSDLLRRYILEEIPEAEATAALIRDLMHPENIYRRWLPSAGTSWIELRDRLNWTIDAALKQAAQLSQSASTHKASLATFRQQFDGRFDTELRKEIRESEKVFAEIAASPFNVRPIRIFSREGAERLEESFQCVVTAVLNQLHLGKLRRAPSLAGDLMHAAYLPVCDLWRCDRAMARTLHECDHPYRKRIVDDLLLLPAMIDDAIVKNT